MSPSAKLGQTRRALVQSPQEIARLDDDLILVARAMARAEAEGVVIRVVGGGEELGEALPTLGIAAVDRAKERSDLPDRSAARLRCRKFHTHSPSCGPVATRLMKR